MTEKYGILTKSRTRSAWTEEVITSIGEGLSLALPKIDQEEFVKRCVDAVPERKPTNGARDIRRQDIVRALRRMAKNDRLPFRVVGDDFVF